MDKESRHSFILFRLIKGHHSVQPRTKQVRARANEAERAVDPEWNTEFIIYRVKRRFVYIEKALKHLTRTELCW